MPCRLHGPQFLAGSLRKSLSSAVARRSLSQNLKRVQSIGSLLEKSVEGFTSDVEVDGHVRTIRNQKQRSFIELGDGSTTETLQALLLPQQAVGIGTGTALRISGSWKPCPATTQQSHELVAGHVRILGEADVKYPLQKKYHSPTFLRTLPHLRLRLPVNALIARLRSECEYNVSTHFRNNGFVRVHPPIITGADAEGAGETLSITPFVEPDGAVTEFFHGSRHLSVSSQLHLEAYVHEHPRVWTLSPTFRAERSDTPRHLSEFYMLEAEMRTESLDDVMHSVETMIRDVVLSLRPTVLEELLRVKGMAKRSGDLQDSQEQVLLRRWEGLERQYWPRVPYHDAIKLLQAANDGQRANFQYAPKWELGLQLEHERFLAAEIGQGGPVFVTHYPRALKPFYMLPGDDDTVACFDLLVPEVAEIVGGSLREHRASHLESVMRERGLLDAAGKNPFQSLWWYLELRKYGSVPHGGYGIGFDRLIGYLAGVDNLRDVVAWPRHFGHCIG